jgi:hypothetical protein
MIPRISFGVIVLNGEPFTKYCLRQIYPYAYEIIVVEGGSRKAIDEAPCGHSVDGTLESLREFKAKEDPENKLIIISKEGFWEEKDEQSQAYAAMASGDYLWQVDIDEFYTWSTMESVCKLLCQHPEITAMSFRQITFWGAPTYYCDNHFLRFYECRRLFKWGKGYKYITHRPPTVCNDAGVDLHRISSWNTKMTFSYGIILCHYSLLFPGQVKNKCSYYSKRSQATNKGFSQDAMTWFQNSYQKLGNPFRVHNVYKHISWLAAYRGQHPEQITKLWADIRAGVIQVQTRDNNDVEQLLSRIYYRVMVAFLKILTKALEISFLHHSWRLWNKLIDRMDAK